MTAPEATRKRINRDEAGREVFDNEHSSTLLQYHANHHGANFGNDTGRREKALGNGG